MFRPELIALSRQRLGVPEEAGIIPNEAFYSCYNRAARQFARDTRLLRGKLPVAIVAGSQTYPIPSRLIPGGIEWIGFTEGASEWELPTLDYGQLPSDWETEAPSTPDRIVLLGVEFLLYPKPIADATVNFYTALLPEEIPEDEEGDVPSLPWLLDHKDALVSLLSLHVIEDYAELAELTARIPVLVERYERERVRITKSLNGSRRTVVGGSRIKSRDPYSRFYPSNYVRMRR